MAAPTKLSEKALTAHLNRLASEVIDISADGTPITREERLAELIWQQALGWKEETRDDDGNIKTIIHKPVAWAQQFIWERREGKAPIAAPEQTTGVRALDKIRSLARDRLNALATAAVTPPTYRPTRTDSSGSGSSDSGSDAPLGGTERPDGT